jgi:5-methylcytosine-specific restriction endonuclease McrA
MIGRPKSPETRARMRQAARRGPANPSWRGNRTARQMFMSSPDYREWRDAVFRRDNYTCQRCGVRGHKGLGRRVVLHAHHIKPFALYPELRLVVSNGLTLCRDCHLEAP